MYWDREYHNNYTKSRQNTTEGFEFYPPSARGFVKVAGNQCKWKTISNSIAKGGKTEILQHVKHIEIVKLNPNLTL